MSGGASPYGLVHTEAGVPVAADLDPFGLSHGHKAPPVRNVALILEGDRAHLIAFDPADGRTAGCIQARPDGAPVLAPLGGPAFWRWEPGEHHFTLTGPAGTLRALPDGTLCAAGPGNPRLAILSSLTCDCLDALRAGTWIAASGRAVDTTLRHQSRPTFSIGGQIIDLAGLPGPFIPHGSGLLRQIDVCGPGGRLHRMALFNPVVCLAVFGDESYYQLLNLALQSLHEFGGYTGAICIAADRPHDRVAAHIPAPFQSSWRHVPATRAEGLFARYRMPEWGLEAHQPVLYLDADVVTNAPIQPLLARLATTQRVHVATEDWRARYGQPKPAELADMEGGNWFGAWLLANDPRFAGRPQPFASSGIIGADTAGRLAVPFAMVRALRHAVDPALVDQWTDQALANYALHASFMGDFTLLDRHVDFARDAALAGMQRRGFMHFHAWVGAGEQKLLAMRTYVTWLREGE